MDPQLELAIEQELARYANSVEYIPVCNLVENVVPKRVANRKIIDEFVPLRKPTRPAKMSLQRPPVNNRNKCNIASNSHKPPPAKLAKIEVVQKLPPGGKNIKMTDPPPVTDNEWSSPSDSEPEEMQQRRPLMCHIPISMENGSFVVTDRREVQRKTRKRKRGKKSAAKRYFGLRNTKFHEF